MVGESQKEVRSIISGGGVASGGVVKRGKGIAEGGIAEEGQEWSGFVK